MGVTKTIMDHEEAFLQAIAEEPEDESLKLIFADWLDERGDPRGTWLRQHELREWMGPRCENPVPKLIETLKANTKAYAVRRALVAIGESAVPALVDAFEEGDWRVREHAGLCLKKMGESAKSAVPMLVRMLSAEDRTTKQIAAITLMAIGPQPDTDVEALRAVLTDQSGEVRKVARDFLAQLESKEALVGELQSNRGRTPLRTGRSFNTLRASRLPEPWS